MTRAVRESKLPKRFHFPKTLTSASPSEQLARARGRRPFMELCAAGTHTRLTRVGQPTHGLGAARGRPNATLARAADARSGFSGAQAAAESGRARVEHARPDVARGPRFAETRFRASAPERVTRARTSVAPRGGAARSAAADLASGGDPSGDDENQPAVSTREAPWRSFAAARLFASRCPWGLFVALCGLAGFVIAGSTKSLVFGGGFGGLLMILGALSLKKWKEGKGSAVETTVSFGITAALGAMMGKKVRRRRVARCPPASSPSARRPCACSTSATSLRGATRPARRKPRRRTSDVTL
jgi:hypothetical protein